MKKLLIFCFCVLTVLIVSPFAASGHEYTEVVRFHVRAASDSVRDQNVKLAVRDEAVKLVAYITKDCNDAAEAKAAIEQHLSDIATASDAVLRSHGFYYGAKAYISVESFPDKHYGEVDFPKGIYTALRIDLGSAKGENFWCVMFPPICLADVCVEQTLSDYGINEFTAFKKPVKISLRFKLWEYIKKLF